jgi:carbonic anhydrase/acetyltransferase-like protein (isoleucine patch superfamily)
LQGGIIDLVILGTSSLWEEFDQSRRVRGLLTPAELLALPDIVVLDPFSVILSRQVSLGPGNLLYPGVVIECDEQSRCVIGRDNVFHVGTRILVSSGGSISIGDRSVVGEGGAQIKATTGDCEISIGDETRIMNGAELLGHSKVGSGCQILGPISARSVDLAAGAAYTHLDPDQRGAVLKGFGRAQGLRVGVGEVINGVGDFRSAPVERQRAHHPDAPSVSPH